MNPQRTESSPQVRGIVLRFQRKSALVRSGEAEFQCALRKGLFRDLGRWSNPIAVGDQVVLEEVRDGGGVIVQVLPRRSHLSRVRPEARDEQIIVANADLLVAMVAAADPTFRPRLFDRLLVAAHRGSMPCLLLVTKADLVADRAPLLAAAARYRALGVEFLLTSLLTREGLPEVARAFAGRVVVVAGQSGVGKSSLLNHLYAGLGQATQEISSKWGKGCHTTTSAAWFSTPDGGAVIDTPGVRSFAIQGLEAVEVAEAFPEIWAERVHCRFGTCTHDHEPGCGVKAAASAGRVSPERLDSYQRIIHGLDEDE